MKELFGKMIDSNVGICVLAVLGIFLIGAVTAPFRSDKTEYWKQVEAQKVAMAAKEAADRKANAEGREKRDGFVMGKDGYWELRDSRRNDARPGEGAGDYLDRLQHNGQLK
jgi:hypothetical protein